MFVLYWTYNENEKLNYKTIIPWLHWVKYLNIWSANFGGAIHTNINPTCRTRFAFRRSHSGCFWVRSSISDQSNSLVSSQWERSLSIYKQNWWGHVKLSDWLDETDVLQRSIQNWVKCFIFGLELFKLYQVYCTKIEYSRNVLRNSPCS